MSQSAAPLPISPSSSPSPQAESSVVQLPRGPLSPMQQLEALRRVQLQAEQKLKLGTQLFKAAQTTASQHLAVVEQLRREQSDLRERMREDLEQSLGRFELRLNHAENGLTQGLDKVNERLERLESEWGQMQLRMEAMAARADALLMQATDVLGQSAQMLTQVAAQQSGPASNQAFDRDSATQAEAPKNLPAAEVVGTRAHPPASVNPLSPVLAVEDTDELPRLVEEEVTATAEPEREIDAESDIEDAWFDEIASTSAPTPRLVPSEELPEPPTNRASAMNRIRFAVEEDVAGLGRDDLRIRLVPQVEEEPAAPEPVIDLSDLHLLLPPEERGLQAEQRSDSMRVPAIRRYGLDHPAIPELQPKLTLAENLADLFEQPTEEECSESVSLELVPEASGAPLPTTSVPNTDSSTVCSRKNVVRPVLSVREASNGSEMESVDGAEPGEHQQAPASAGIDTDESIAAVLAPTEAPILGPMLIWPAPMLLSDVLPMPPGEMVALTHPDDGRPIERETASAVDTHGSHASASTEPRDRATRTEVSSVTASQPVAPQPTGENESASSAAAKKKRVNVIRVGSAEAQPQASPKAEAAAEGTSVPRYVRAPAADGVAMENEADRETMPSDFYRKIVARLRQQIEDEKKL